MSSYYECPDCGPIPATVDVEFNMCPLCRKKVMTTPDYDDLHYEPPEEDEDESR